MRQWLQWTLDFDGDLDIFGFGLGCEDVLNVLKHLVGVEGLPCDVEHAVPHLLQVKQVVHECLAKRQRAHH